MERVFEVMRCPDEDRVQLATFLLKRNVYHWWKTIRRDYADPTSITWVEFRLIFDEQFYPRSYRYAKKNQVLEFETGVNVCTGEISASSARRRDMSSFGGPSQGPSKRYGSSSNSAGSGWSGGRGSSSGSGRCGPMPTWSQNSDQQSVVKVKVVPLHQLFKSECPILSQGGTARQGTVAQQGQGNRGQSQSQSGASSSAVGSSSNIRVQSTFRGRDGRHWRG
ncbi:unnamed protein product [Prunus armeniaca]